MLENRQQSAENIWTEGRDDDGENHTVNSLIICTFHLTLLGAL